MAKAAKKIVKKATIRKLVSKPAARRPVKPSQRGKPAAQASGNKERFTLHGFSLSGPTYTVALMLSLCRHPESRRCGMRDLPKAR